MRLVISVRVGIRARLSNHVLLIIIINSSGQLFISFFSSQLQMESEVLAAVKELKVVLELAMNPNTDQQIRLEAYKTCENFKETSPLCSACGVVLADKEQNHVMRHFGLHLLEHSVKNRWNEMLDEEKLFIKNVSMQLMREGTFDIITEETHIKDALSRITVEMVKREWPQQWPTFMEELQDLCNIGPTQTELVLLILLRLSEDVVSFQTVPTRRRRELLQALVSNMDNLYVYFLTTLKTNFADFQQLKSSGDTSSLAEVKGRVAYAVLHTLCGMVDILTTNLLMKEGGLLFQLLCLMLRDTTLQLPAAECLLLIANRKGKLEERKALLILFSDDAMSAILTATQEASQAALDEHHYVFLKKLCQLLVAIGNQLTALWGSCNDVEQPSSFRVYLQAILQFTLHPSQVLASFTNALWLSCLRHPFISQNPIFLEVLPQVIIAAKTSLLKVGFPSQANSPSCCYARLDFDSDEDFHVFFSKYRRDVGETVRYATTVSPTLLFQCAVEWMTEQLNKPVNTTSDHCTLSSPAFLEWDALSVFLECVMSRLVIHTPLHEGITLLKAVLSYESQDPLILSSILSCTSSLFVFIKNTPEILPSVLDKIFSSAVFNMEGQTKATRSKAVKNVRRHACSVLVKICKQYPDLMLPSFDQLYSHIRHLSSKLSQMEECTLIEALILISNRFKDFKKQSQFLGEVLVPVRAMWINSPLQESLWDVDKFMTYVGLDQAPVEPSSEDTCGINRSKIIYCVNTILAVLKRSTWPSDPNEAQTGGFLANGEAGVFLNPAQPHLLVMLDNVLALLRTLNALWLPDHLVRRHAEFQAAYDLMDVDKQHILGNLPPCVDNSNASSCKQPLERMQSFLSSVHDNCYHIIGNAGSCLGPEFYELPSLTTSLLNSALTNLHLVPEYRLKPVIRSFCKPYVQACPSKYYEKAVVPVLMAICPIMIQRLSSKWQLINQKRESSGDDEEVQEVLEEQVVRQLTREYLDLLMCVLREKRGGGEAGGEDMGEDAAMEEEAESQQQKLHQQQQQQPPYSKDERLSELGVVVLQSPDLFSSVIMAILQGLAWNDTQTCVKCIHLFFPILHQLSTSGKLTGEDACHVLSGILQGLERHGQHEGNQAMLITLALHAYENLRPIFPQLTSVMMQIPNCTEQAVRAFDDKLLSSGPQRQMTEKFKKDSFKRLVQDIIGQNIGQLFRSESHIKNLPPMFKRPKMEKPSLLDTEGDGDIGICSLFDPIKSESH